jgi:hypothetical protein
MSKHNFKDIPKGKSKDYGEYSAEAMRKLCSSAIAWSKRNGGKFKTYKDDNRLMIIRVK